MNSQLNQVVMRDYRESDWEQVCAIHDAARPQEVAGVMPPGTFLIMEKTAEDEGFFDDQKFVACAGGSDGPVIGFIAIRDAWITWVYVLPSAQGQGVGKAMIDHIRPLVGPDGALTVLTTNTAAIGFYQAQGFVQAAVMPGDCEGFACDITRMCFPTSKYVDMPPKPMESSLLLAGFSAENWGHGERDDAGVWRWVRQPSQA